MLPRSKDMPVNVIRARLNSLRKNLPTQDVEESVIKEFNGMVRQLEEELPDPEVTHFLVPDSDLRKQFIFGTEHSAVYTDERYCDPRILKRQVEGLWEYLVDSKVIESDTPEPKRGRNVHSRDIHFHAPVSGSVIQQGSYNTATVNYQSDVRQVLEEIRSVQNAAKLTADAKDELRAEVATVEAQLKSPRPKHAIIKESFTSARHILEHAFGAGMAHYFPLLLAFLEHHK
jgi:hypothetical protein